MRNTTKRYVIICLCLFGICLTSMAQSFEEDYKRFVEVYVKSNNISYDVSVRGLDNNGKEIERNKSSIRRRDNLFRSESNGVITIANGDCGIMINQRKKMIVCQPFMDELEEEDRDDRNIMEQLDELFEYAETEVEFKGKGKWGNYYRIELNSMGIRTMDIHFDSDTGFLRHIKYEHDMEISTIAKTEIDYLDFSNEINPRLDLSVFSEKEYVNISDNGVTLKSEFKDYELIVSDFE